MPEYITPDWINAAMPETSVNLIDAAVLKGIPVLSPKME